MILLSARAGEEATLAGLASGANDYLVKPFSAREVLARIQLWLEIARLRKATELARERLQDLFMQAPAVICVLRGPNHVYELANPLYHQLVGQRTLLGLSVREALPELEGQGFYELLDQVYTTGQPFLGTEVKVTLDRGNDGQMEEGSFNFVYQPTRNEWEQIDGILVHAVEVTEQIQSRKLLQDSEQRLRVMAESMPQKIFTAQPNGDVDYFNPQWMEFPGLSFEEIRDWGWTQFVHPDDVAENIRLWTQAIQTGDPFYCEHRFRRVDGVYRWHSSRAIPIRNAQGHITMWIGPNTDISEQKDLAHQKETFISMATHELKTPLTALQGNMQLAERALHRLQKGLDGQQTGQHQIVEQALLLLTRGQENLRVQNRLITDLLDVSRMQTNTLELRQEICDLVALVEETVQDYQAAYPQRGITLQRPEKEPLMVQGDRDRIMQVLSNYVTNALKYSADDKTVEIGVTYEHPTVCVWY